MSSISTQMCFGVEDSHVQVRASGSVALAPATWLALDVLMNAARSAGFTPQVASGFRSFARQQQIWNEKAQGLRPVLDDAGQALALHTLSDWAAVQAILRWSALPGTSRHHWGSDFDIYDTSRMPQGYRLALTPAECAPGGVCGDFHQWLDGYLAAPDAAFSRPYLIDTGGVAIEPWHLSHKAQAQAVAPLLTLEAYADFIADQDLAFKAVILSHLPDIFTRFVRL